MQIVVYKQDARRRNKSINKTIDIVKRVNNNLLLCNLVIASNIKYVVSKINKIKLYQLLYQKLVAKYKKFATIKSAHIMHKIYQKLKFNKEIYNVNNKTLAKNRVKILSKDTSYLVVINNIKITKIFILYNNVFRCSRDLSCLIEIIEFEQYYCIIKTTIVDKASKSCFLFFVVALAKNVNNLLINIEILNCLSSA